MAVVGCVSIGSGCLGFSASCFAAGIANEEVVVLGTNFLFSEEETDGNEGVLFSSAIVGVSAFVVVNKVGGVLFDGILVLSTGIIGIGIEVLRDADKLLEAPFDDCIAFPLGAGVEVDMIIAPSGEVTIRAPQCGQKCAADVAKGALQLLQFSGLCGSLCVSWCDLVVLFICTHFLSNRTFS
jgi:hypothetical protein